MSSLYAIGKSVSFFVPVLFGGVLSFVPFGNVFGFILIVGLSNYLGEIVSAKVVRLFISKKQEDENKMYAQLAEAFADHGYIEMSRRIKKSPSMFGNSVPRLPDFSKWISRDVFSYVEKNKGSLLSLLCGSAALSACFSVGNDVMWRYYTDVIIGILNKSCFLPNAWKLGADMLASKVVQKYWNSAKHGIYKQLPPRIRTSIRYVMKRKWVCSLLTCMFTTLQLSAKQYVMMGTMDGFYNMVDLAKGIDRNAVSLEMGKRVIDETLFNAYGKKTIEGEDMSKAVVVPAVVQNSAAGIGKMQAKLAQFRKYQLLDKLIGLDEAGWNKLTIEQKGEFMDILPSAYLAEHRQGPTALPGWEVFGKIKHDVGGLKKTAIKWYVWSRKG